MGYIGVIMENQMEKQMENEMEAGIIDLKRDCIGLYRPMGLYRGYIGIMEKKVEATV